MKTTNKIVMGLCGAILMANPVLANQGQLIVTGPTGQNETVGNHETTNILINWTDLGAALSAATNPLTTITIAASTAPASCAPDAQGMPRHGDGITCNACSCGHSCDGRVQTACAGRYFASGNAGVCTPAPDGFRPYQAGNPAGAHCGYEGMRFNLVLGDTIVPCIFAVNAAGEPAPRLADGSGPCGIAAPERTPGYNITGFTVARN